MTLDKHRDFIISRLREYSSELHIEQPGLTWLASNTPPRLIIDSIQFFDILNHKESLSKANREWLEVFEGHLVAMLTAHKLRNIANSTS